MGCLLVMSDADGVRLAYSFVVSLPHWEWIAVTHGARLARAFQAASTIFILIFELTAMAPVDAAAVTPHAPQLMDSVF